MPGRYVHDLLHYEPTYKCWLKKKKKKPKKKKTVISEEEREELESQPIESLCGKERAPVDRISPEPFESEDMAPKLDLKAKLAEMAAAKKQAPKKSSGAPVPPGKVQASTTLKAASARARPSGSAEEKAPKRTKVTITITDKDDEGKETAKDDDVRAETSKTARPFAPVFVTEDGRCVSDEDSVNADERLAMALLPGLVLKKDLELVPKRLEENLNHCSSEIVKVSEKSHLFSVLCIPCTSVLLPMLHFINSVILVGRAVDVSFVPAGG